MPGSQTITNRTLDLNRCKKMSELKQQFEDAVKFVQSGDGDFKPENDLKLQFYALYKQATEGD
ncbi:MAG: acyl-CoA-binding protein, partial [Ketobacter sp.]